MSILRHDYTKYLFIEKYLINVELFIKIYF